MYKIVLSNKKKVDIMGGLVKKKMDESDGLNFIL